MYSITRTHEIHCGHRVVGHEGKCRHLHGHSYVFHFTCIAERLDLIGRVIDFSEVKAKLCEWLETNWDHKFLAWDKDPVMTVLREASEREGWDKGTMLDSIIFVPFNPTAENLAEYMVRVVGPMQLAGTGIVLDSCTVEETSKCCATYERGNRA